MADSVAAQGLVREDLEGHCMFIEGGTGLIGGASGAAMLFGLDAKLLAMTAATLTPVGNLLLPNDSAVRLLRSAKDVIMAAGLNAGLQAGAGATISLGGLFQIQSRMAANHSRCAARFGQLEWVHCFRLLVCALGYL